MPKTFVLQYITNTGSKIVLRTDKGAPNYRLICIDLENPAEENWKTLIAVRFVNDFAFQFSQYFWNVLGTRERRLRLGCMCERWQARSVLHSWRQGNSFYPNAPTTNWINKIMIAERLASSLFRRRTIGSNFSFGYWHHCWIQWREKVFRNILQLHVIFDAR